MQTPAIFLIFLDMILLFVFVWPHFMAPFQVTVYEHRGEKGLRVRKAYGTKKVDKQDGTEKIWLSYPFRRFVEMADLNNLVPINGRQDQYNLYRDTSGNFRPFSPLDLQEQLKNIQLVVEDKDVARWAQQERKQVITRLLKKDEHWVKAYWPQIGLAIVFTLAIASLIFVGYYATSMVETGINAAQAQTSKMLEAGNNYAKIILFAMGEEIPQGNIIMANPEPVVQNVTEEPKPTFGLLPV